MAKKLFGLIAAAILAFAGAIFVACGGGGEDDTLTLSGFDVPAETQVAYGSIYTIPDYVVTDRNGTIYTVEVVVTNGGETITPVGGQIDIDRMTDYTITFTVVLGEGNTQQKQTILKVVDGNAPRVTLGEMQRVYIVGEDIALPTVEIADNIDTGLTAQFSVRSGGETVLASVTDSFKLETAGAYELVATVTDSSGNIGTDTANFVVRAAANIGEIEDFADEYAALSVSPAANYGETLTGETAEIGGQTAFKINSKDTAGNITLYPGLSLTPRISLADVQALKAEGFTAVTMNVYLEHTASRNIYQQWAVDEAGKPDQSDPVAVQPNRWTAFTFDLDLFISAYDDIASGEILFFYFGNEEEWTVDHVSADFNFYVKDIYVTKQLSDVAIDADLEETYAQGATVDISGITAASASEAEAGFDIVVTDPLGNEYTPADGEIVASAYGMYTVSARPDAHSKRFIGSATRTFNVLPNVDSIEEIVERILAADDKTDADIVADAALLENWANILGEIEGADQLDMFRYYAAMTLTDEFEEDKLMYFDTALGREQVTTQYNTNTPVPTKNGITLDTATTYNGAPTTKIEFTDVPEAWFGPFRLNFSYVDSATDLSDYTHIRFYLRGYTYNAARPVTYFLVYNGERFTDPVSLTSGWTEVTIDLAAEGITDLSLLTVAFNTLNNGSGFGSLSNIAGNFYANISAVYGIVNVDDIQINSSFSYETEYDLNDTLDLSAFTASSAKYPNVTFEYTMEHEGITQALPASITFSDSGWYTFTASVASPYIGEESIRVYVNGTDANPTVEYIEETVEAILAGDRKDPDIIARAEVVKEWAGMLDTVYGADQLDMFRFYAAMTLTDEFEDDKLMYFDTALGREQVTTQYNINTPVPTKNGITLDTATTYNGAPTTKIEFTDVSGWFSPYLFNFTFPSSADLSEYTHIRFYLRGYSSLMDRENAEDRPLEYAVLYNGTRFIQPTVLANGEWTEILIDLEANNITDLSGLTIAFYSLNGSDEWGAIEASYFYANISAVYGVRMADDIQLASDTRTAYTLGETIDWSSFAVESEKYPDLAYDYTINGTPAEEFEFSAAGTYTLTASVTTPGYIGEQTFTITIFEPEAFGTITVAEAEDTISQIVPRGNGTDKTDNSYVADFNGRDAIMAETNPQTSSSNANSYKWPGIDIHTSLTVEDLNTYKGLGYTTMVIPVYITDSSVNSLDIYYGPDGALISAVATGEWVELEIPIDTVIGSYDTTLSNYFIYINNYVSGETIGGYITYYIADITLTA